MKNKTKLNLKRALLFFIPLCLIAGMFAVPAFAIDGAPSVSDLFQPATEQVYINEGDNNFGIDGDYAVIIDYVSFYDLAVGGGYLDQTLFESSMYYDVLRLNSNYEIIGAYEYVSGIRYDYDDEQYYIRLGLALPGGSNEVVLTECAWVVLSFDAYPPEFTSSEASTFEINLLDYDYGEPVRFVTITTGSAGGDDGGAGDTSGIFAVWSEITDWIINGLTSATNAFYYNGQLTLLGYLCIIPLALGVALLLISIVQKFLHLRG